MRAAMITRYQQPLEIVNLADPKLPKDGIIMRVRATGVCRSDWHTWMGHYADQITLPLIPGHEMAGDVVEVGSDVTGLVPGDRVTVPFGLACGRCYTCLDGNHQSCITQVQPVLSDECELVSVWPKRQFCYPVRRPRHSIRAAVRLCLK